jgi:hypothetical protein
LSGSIGLYCEWTSISRFRFGRWQNKHYAKKDKR